MHHRCDIPKQVWAGFPVGDTPVASMSVTPLAGGLSGSGVWKISSPEVSYCLKNMPLGFPVNHLRRIHHAGGLRRGLGMDILAAYLPARRGETYVEADGRLWELQSWQAGTPATLPLTSEEKRQMVLAVARFHQIVQGMPSDPARHAPSPAVAARAKLTQAWQQRSAAGLKDQIETFGMPQQRPVFHQFVDSFYQYAGPLEQRLNEILSTPFLLADCLGDPRPENFLFTERKLTGLIDLSSLRTDNWALDWARLGSELAEDGRPDWEGLFAMLEPVATLTPRERRLVWTLDLANILLTGLNWLQWLVIEKRVFSSSQQVAARLHHLERRLAFVAEHPAWKV